MYSAPSAWWMAATGTTSLRRESVGGPCRDVAQRLAAAGYHGSCKLAPFDGRVDIAGAQRAELAGNSAAGSTSFSLGVTRLGGVVIEVTPLAAN